MAEGGGELASSSAKLWVPGIKEEGGGEVLFAARALSFLARGSGKEAEAEQKQREQKKTY